MKLYYSPGACSLSPHIVLREAGLPFELERVDLATKKTASGGDFLAVNPKGYVPALALDDGSMLTEGPAIVQYLADLRPQSGLAPAAGEAERYHLQEWLNFISSELHKGFGLLFRRNWPEAARQAIEEWVSRRLDYLVDALGERPYLMGQRFTVADAYLFTVLNWHRALKFELSRWPALLAYQQRVAARPAVQAALQAEGLSS
jgi:glutathione S-transferase